MPLLVSQLSKYVWCGFPLGVSASQVKTMLLPANMSGAEKREKM
jgi:hypothetical protein